MAGDAIHMLNISQHFFLDIFAFDCRHSDDNIKDFIERNMGLLLDDTTLMADVSDPSCYIHYRHIGGEFLATHLVFQL